MNKKLSLVLGGAGIALFLTKKYKQNPLFTFNQKFSGIIRSHKNIQTLIPRKNLITNLFQSKIAACDNSGPFLGCSIRAIDRDQGMIILIINSGGPAQKSGLKQGDIILEIDGMRVKNITDYKSAIGMDKDKERSFKIKRDQQEIQIKVKM